MAGKNGYNILVVLIIIGAVGVCTMAAYTLMADAGEAAAPDDYLLKITSEEELRQFLNENRGYRYSEYDAGFIPGMKRTLNTAEVSVSAEASKGSLPAPMTTPAPTAFWNAGESTGTYSTTNVQVENVDEADFVKNDGRYIYIVSGGRLVIVGAFPPEDAGIISETDIEGTPRELFINKDKLVLFYNGQKEVWVTPEGSSAPVPVTNEILTAEVFDISDRKKPVSVRTIEVPGSYENSRMIGDFVYMISKDPVYGSYDNVIMPYVIENGEEAEKPVVWCPRIPASSYIMHTITAFSVTDEKKTGSESFLLGYDNTLYVSADNAYLAYQKESGYYRSPSPMYFDEEESVSSYETYQKTVIHRFSIDREKIEYAATGEVSGRLLNQFSLDEYRENLRVATTVDSWMSADGKSYNNVYVLGSDLKLKGKLEKLAPGESIYSARFMGDLLYLVTFKRIDPFFVIDLSNPEQPGILGKLKIPGYSDYLHPLDEKHIIGIGKSTYENEWGGVTEGGVKIALFDVSDLNNPVCIDEVEIGDSGSESEVLNDHRAFLLDKRESILVLPVTEITKIPVKESRYDSYSRGLWNGAYVFEVSPDSGFTLKGKTTHSEESETGYSYMRNDRVRRSLFMDDALYTISDQKIVASSLDDPEMIISEVKLPSSGKYPYYYGDVVF